MERSDVIDAMGKLRLYGMRAAYDEALTTAVIRRDLLDLCERETRSGAHCCFFVLSIDTIYLDSLFS